MGTSRRAAHQVLSQQASAHVAAVPEHLIAAQCKGRWKPCRQSTNAWCGVFPTAIPYKESSVREGAPIKVTERR